MLLEESIIAEVFMIDAILAFVVLMLVLYAPVKRRLRNWLFALLVYVVVEMLFHKFMEDAAAEVMKWVS